MITDNVYKFQRVTHKQAEDMLTGYAEKAGAPGFRVVALVLVERDTGAIGTNDEVAIHIAASDECRAPDWDRLIAGISRALYFTIPALFTEKR